MEERGGIGFQCEDRTASGHTQTQTHTPKIHLGPIIKYISLRISFSYERLLYTHIRTRWNSLASLLQVATHRAALKIQVYFSFYFIIGRNPETYFIKNHRGSYRLPYLNLFFFELTPNEMSY